MSVSVSAASRTASTYLEIYYKGSDSLTAHQYGGYGGYDDGGYGLVTSSSSILCCSLVCTATGLTPVP